MHNRQVIVDKIMSWLGCHEGDATHKHIIDTYNSHKPLARGYKVKYTDAWCATTVSAAAIECGYTDIIPTECSCNKMIELLQKMGIWQENDAYSPGKGDILFYDWQDNGVGDDDDPSEHVGIVVSEPNANGMFQVCEGNKNDGVNLRNMSVNGKYIRGYGVPKYDEVVVQKKTDLVYGIDISAYQGSVDFAKVKADGYQFVILRSTTKNGKPDKMFEQYWSGATKAGLKIAGVYKLCYARSPQEAQREAEGVLKLLNGRKCDIWLDMENDGGQQTMSVDAIALIITAFLTTCVNAGYDVGIYCNVDWYKNHIKYDIKNICRFWIARYPKKENDDGTIHEDLRTDYKGQVLWQFSSKGKVAGISGDVDLDVKC